MRAAWQLRARRGELGSQAWRMKDSHGIGGPGGGGNGDCRPDGSTCAEPPPVRTPTSAWPPMTDDGVDCWRSSGRTLLLVLEQDDALLCDALRELVAAFDVGDLLDDRMVEEAGSEDGAQNAVHVIVELVLGDFAASTAFLSVVAEEGRCRAAPCRGRRARLWRWSAFRPSRRGRSL